MDALSVRGARHKHGRLLVDAADASRIGHQLIDRGFSGDEVYLIPPRIVLEQITPTVRDTDNPLPSAGTDAATVRAYTKLAREGHTALLVRTKDEATANRLMVLVREVPYSIAQRYRTLVIEDL